MSDQSKDLLNDQSNESYPESGMKPLDIPELSIPELSSDELTTQRSDSDVVESDATTSKVRRKRKRRSLNLPLLGIGLAILSVWGLYVLVMPELQLEYLRRLSPNKKVFPAELDFNSGQRILLRTCEFLFVGWVFYFGASIGSFLNVVAGRVPEGRTIVFGGSMCPFCNARLSFIDNTPVLGWLLVRGRCRTCHLPIAPRYLLIEIVVGACFVWLAVWQLLRGGANLPHADLNVRVGVTEVVLYPNWSLIGLFLMHASMFSILVMMTTASGAKKAFPVGAFMFIVALFVIPKIGNPILDVVSWSEPWIRFFPKLWNGHFSSMLSFVIGGFVGAGAGWITSRFIGSVESKVMRRHWILQAVLIGAVNGWQAALPILILGTGLAKAYTWIRHAELYPYEESKSFNPIGINTCLVLVCMLHQSFWRQLAQYVGIF